MPEPTTTYPPPTHRDVSPPAFTNGRPNQHLKQLNRLSRDDQIFLERQLLKTLTSGARKVNVLHRYRLAIERQLLSHYLGEPPAWRLHVRRVLGRRTTPDFCVIGPLKAGTTDLATNILLHPCVLTPLAKEIAESDWYRLSSYYPTERTRLRKLKKYGTALSPYLTPLLHSAETAHRLAHVNPRMKVVIVLRNPISRLYSHWKWDILLSGTRRLSATRFMDTFDAYVEHSIRTYPSVDTSVGFKRGGLAGSIYWQAVWVWIDCFGIDNLLIVESEEYFRNKVNFLYKLQDFVGLPRMTVCELARKVNENPLQFAPPRNDTLVMLKDFFQPHNERLWDLIGKNFAW